MFLTANYVECEGHNKRRKVVAEDVVHYCMKMLMPRHRTLTIWINIGPIEKGADGFCLEVEKNIFEIEVSSKLSLKDFVSTICHEMVHVKQHVRRELVSTRGGRQLWKGRDHSKTDYDDQPWEQEAYDLQDILADGYFSHRRK